jgi:hypothetical protein
MKLHFACVLAVGALAGCATDQGPKPTVGAASPKAEATAAYRSADFAWSTTPGKGQIDGQVAYKAGGVAYGCTASGVILTPETPWVRSRMLVLYNSANGTALPADEVRRRTPPERAQDYSAFIKRAKCGPSGEFTFAGLPDGAWYVITVARPANSAPGVEMALMRRVVVRGGRTVKARL